MKHINQLAQQLQVSTEIVRNICQLLDLEISGNTVSEQVESQLSNLKTVADKENMSLEEAARHLVEMRNSSEETGDRKFNKREYIKQRFGVDPEQASEDSFVGMLTGIQIEAFSWGNYVIELSLNLLLLLWKNLYLVELEII